MTDERKAEIVRNLFKCEKGNLVRKESVESEVIYPRRVKGGSAEKLRDWKRKMVFEGNA